MFPAAADIAASIANYLCRECLSAAPHRVLLSQRLAGRLSAILPEFHGSRRFSHYRRTMALDKMPTNIAATSFAVIVEIDIIAARFYR